MFIAIKTGFNADLRSTLQVTTEGWTKVNGWRVVGLINGLYQARAKIGKHEGRFLPFGGGMCVCAYEILGRHIIALNLNNAVS